MAYRPPQLQVDRSGRAFVSKMISGERYRIPMGVAGTPQCSAAYRKFLREYKQGTFDWTQEHHESGPSLPLDSDQVQSVGTLAEAVEMFLDEITLRDIHKSEKCRYRDSLVELVKLWKAKPVDHLRPKQIKAYRRHLVMHKGWGYSMVSQAEPKVRAFLAWCVEEELCDPRTHWMVVQMKKIQKGELGLSKPKRTRPVGMVELDAVTPFLSDTIRDMALTQFLCGMRPGEVKRMRGRTSTCSDPDSEWYGEQHGRAHPAAAGQVTFLYTFFEHKNMKKTETPLVKAIPNAAMELLWRHLDREDETTEGRGWLFRPSVTRAERVASGMWGGQGRTTKPTPSELKRVKAAKMKVRARICPEADHYKRDSYHQALKRGCDAAIKAGMLERPFPPVQLRHGIATHLAQHAGLESAQAFRGHADSKVTRRFYAEVTGPELARVAVEVNRHAKEWIGVTAPRH